MLAERSGVLVTKSGAKASQKPDAVTRPWTKPRARRVRAIRDRLRLVYGTPTAKPHGHPIAELVLTVLSLNQVGDFFQRRSAHRGSAL